MALRGYQKLHNYCAAHDLAGTMQCIRSNANVNGRAKDKNSPLHCVLTQPCASDSGREDQDVIVQALLQAGANVNTPGKDGLSPLHLACQLDMPLSAVCDIVRLLLDSGALVNVTSYNGATPLHLACARKDESTVNLLIAKNANLNARDDNLDSPLHKALQRPYSTEQGKMVVDLIKAGANIHTAGNRGSTPLHLACDVKDLFVIKHLVYRGADVNARNADNDTPLHLVLNSSYTPEHGDIVCYLVDAGADVQVAGSAGNTPLHLPSAWADHTTIHTLLQNGALEIVNAINDRGCTPLQIVITIYDDQDDFRRIDRALVLLESGADVSIGDWLQVTPLHWACGKGDLELVQTLLAFGADPQALTHNGETALFYVVDSENAAEIINILCQAGVNVNLESTSGQTALMKACGAKHIYRPELVEALFQWGADGAELHSSYWSGHGNPGHGGSGRDLFNRVYQSGGAIHLNKLCELGLVLPQKSHKFFPSSMFSNKSKKWTDMSKAVVLCRAGMELSVEIHEHAVSLLPSRRKALFSMYIQFSRAVNPYDTSLQLLVLKEARTRGELVSVLVDLVTINKSPASLKDLATYSIRKHLSEVGGGRSILPQIDSLEVPVDLLGNLRLSPQTEVLVAELIKNS